MNGPRTYVGELGRLVREPGWELLQLRKFWPAAERDVRRKWERLMRSIPSDDPIRRQVDLLHSIKCAADETLHTQALAYILDPIQDHGFGGKVLVALLERIAELNGRAGAARILHSLRRRTTHLRVTPEYRYSIEGFRDRFVARSDVWIETQARKKSALVVIENKIGAAEAREQLAWYERKAAAWCKARGHNRCLLIFLTPDGRSATTGKAQKWMALSYLDLASALRNAWTKNRGVAGSEWLALYITSITRGVLGIDIVRRGGASVQDIETYLGRDRR